MIIKARSPFTIKNIEPAPPTELPRFTCADTVISGLAIAADGTVTNPTVSVGTFHSIEPSTFTTVGVDTSHNVVVKVTYDSNDFRPPSETSTETFCVVTVVQPATVVASTCTTFQVRNYHNNELAYCDYYDCSNQLQSITIAAGNTQDICVYQNTVPSVWGALGAFSFNTNVTCT